MKIITAFMAAITCASAVSAHPTYIGYSGAPGTLGACSASCHHRRNFEPTMLVSGFPEAYEPGTQYIIAASHASGTSIRQFNSSIRQGTTSNNAGVITSGVNTVTYNSSHETNGVHWTSAGRDSGNFVWTAPPAGTGEVRLYWAGLQGNLTSGADTLIVLISSESPTGIDDNIASPDEFSLSQNYPNPFNNATTIEFTLPTPGPAQLSIYTITGQEAYGWVRFVDSPGKVFVRWNGKGVDGTSLPSGLYFYQVETQQGRRSGKMILLK